MSKKTNKPLLNEGTVRRMMKLAEIDSLSADFVTKNYVNEEEEQVDEEKDYTAKKEKPGEDKRKGAEKRGAEGTLAKTKGHGKVDYANEEQINEEEDEEEKELDATEDELGDMDDEADRERDELEADKEEMEDEVSITDEEAQDIIDLADKLKAAMEGGDDSDEEMSMDDEEEVKVDMDMEEPGMRDMMEEELYEAALRGLDIEIVDDKAEQRAALMEQAKAKIYERVIKRLLKESKK
jgi:hypothetical protein